MQMFRDFRVSLDSKCPRQAPVHVLRTKLQNHCAERADERSEKHKNNRTRWCVHALFLQTQHRNAANDERDPYAAEKIHVLPEQEQ